MKLPEQKATEILSAKLGNVELGFRYPIVGDLTDLALLDTSDSAYMAVAIKLLAILLHGYEEDLPTREAYIRSLPIDSVAEFKDNINHILELLGLNAQTKDKKKLRI